LAVVFMPKYDEVKKCTAQPTMRLREATTEAYGNIWDREAKGREQKIESA
jgi:hypothetical protein